MKVFAKSLLSRLIFIPHGNWDQIPSLAEKWRVTIMNRWIIFSKRSDFGQRFLTQMAPFVAATQLVPVSWNIFSFTNRIPMILKKGLSNCLVYYPWRMRRRSPTQMEQADKVPDGTGNVDTSEWSGWNHCRRSHRMISRWDRTWDVPYSDGSNRIFRSLWLGVITEVRPQKRQGLTDIRLPSGDNGEARRFRRRLATSTRHFQEELLCTRNLSLISSMLTSKSPSPPFTGVTVFGIGRVHGDGTDRRERRGDHDVVCYTKSTHERRTLTRSESNARTDSSRIDRRWGTSQLEKFDTNARQRPPIADLLRDGLFVGVILGPQKDEEQITTSVRFFNLVEIVLFSWRSTVVAHLHKRIHRGTKYSWSFTIGCCVVSVIDRCTVWEGGLCCILGCTQSLVVCSSLGHIARCCPHHAFGSRERVS